MTFFWNWINLLSAFLDLTWMNYYFFPMIGIAFLASVPRLLRSLFFWR